MKVSLITYSGMGRPDQIWHAADVMIFTKQTRLQMSPGLFEEIQSWSEEKKLEELRYMANTVPSSWEFNDYTFLISGVTRAFTHQLVRTRTASYAQQAMRVLKMTKWTYLRGPSITGSNEAVYDEAMQRIADDYNKLVDNGANAEDARGILPTNIHTNIVMKINFRAFCDLIFKRMGPRVQNEYREVVVQMHDLVLGVHPWAEIFLDSNAISATKKLDEQIALHISDPTIRMTMSKLIDKIRSGLS